MAEVIGVIEQVGSREAKNGKMMYSFRIGDDWYRTGFNKVTGTEPGYKVKFNYSEDKYGKHVDHVEFKPGEAPPAPAKGSYNRGGGGAASKDKYWADKEARDIETQKRISYQAATNTAIQFVNMAIANECITMPKGKSIAARFEALQQIVQAESDRIFRQYQLVPDLYDEIMTSASQEETADDEPFDDAPANGDVIRPTTHDTGEEW